jgi:hypothetical protein
MLVLAMEVSRGAPNAPRKRNRDSSGAPGSQLGGLRLWKGFGLRPAVLEDCPITSDRQGVTYSV